MNDALIVAARRTPIGSFQPSESQCDRYEVAALGEECRDV